MDGLFLIFVAACWLLLCFLARGKLVSWRAVSGGSGKSSPILGDLLALLGGERGSKTSCGLAVSGSSDPVGWPVVVQ